MQTKEFLDADMLAGDYIDSVIVIKQLLVNGEIEECLFELQRLEAAMQITLAMSERYELSAIN